MAKAELKRPRASISNDAEVVDVILTPSASYTQGMSAMELPNSKVSDPTTAMADADPDLRGLGVQHRPNYFARLLHLLTRRGASDTALPHDEENPRAALRVGDRERGPPAMEGPPQLPNQALGADTPHNSGNNHRTRFTATHTHSTHDNNQENFLRDAYVAVDPFRPSIIASMRNFFGPRTEDVIEKIDVPRPSHSNNGLERLNSHHRRGSLYNQKSRRGAAEPKWGHAATDGKNAGWGTALWQDLEQRQASERNDWGLEEGYDGEWGTGWRDGGNNGWESAVGGGWENRPHSPRPQNSGKNNWGTGWGGGEDGWGSTLGEQEVIQPSLEPVLLIPDRGGSPGLFGPRTPDLPSDSAWATWQPSPPELPPPARPAWRTVPRTARKMKKNEQSLPEPDRKDNTGISVKSWRTWDPDSPSFLSLPPQGVPTTIPASSQPRRTGDYVVAFILDTVPRQVYLHVLLRLPYLYFSRVTRIFEEAELTMPEIKRMALEAVPGSRHGQGKLSRKQRKTTIQLKSTWDSFIDSLLREWKTLNLVSVLLLS